MQQTNEQRAPRVLKIGGSIRVQIEGHLEPVTMRMIEGEEPMNAGNGVALVVRRTPEDEALARAMAAVPELLEQVRISIGNVRSLGPAGALGDVPYGPYKVWLEQLEAAYLKATEVPA